MEILALGISLICLLYIFLFYLLLKWLNLFGDDEELSRQWSGLKGTFHLKIKKLYNLRQKDNTEDFAN